MSSLLLRITKRIAILVAVLNILSTVPCNAQTNAKYTYTRIGNGADVTQGRSLVTR